VARDAEHHRLLRGADTCVSLYVQWAVGRYFDTMFECIQVCQNLDDLNHIGFEVLFSQPNLRRLVGDSPEVHLEDALATSMTSLVVNTLRNTMCSMAFHSVSYPGRLAGLLSDNAATRAGVLQAMERDLHAYEDAVMEAKHHANLRPLVEHSCFNHRFVRVCFAMAASVDIAHVPEKLQDLLTQVHMGFGQSEIVESGWQRARKVETSQQSNRRMSTMRAWRVPIEANLLQQHDREEVAPMQSALKAPRPIPPDIFKASFAKPQGDAESDKERIGLLFHRIMGAPSWPSCSPQSQYGWFAELPLFRFLRDNECWNLAAHRWQCGLIPRGSIFCKVNTQQYILSLGAAHDTALLAWPMELVEVGSNSYFVPSRDPCNSGSAEWIIISNHEDWSIVPTLPSSPLRLWVESGHRPPHNFRLCVCWRQLGAGEGLLAYNAQKAFDGLTEESVGKLLQLLDIAVEENSLGSKLVALIKYCLPGYSIDTIVAMVVKVLHKDTDVELMQWLKDGMMQGVVLAQDEKDIDE
jgi:hypothetical protein